MSKSSNKEKVALLKEWIGSELHRNLFKSIKTYIYNLHK